MKDAVIKIKSYTLHDEYGWLAQVIISDDGLFAAVSEYGNFAFAWRRYTPDSECIHGLLLRMNVDYFASKMMLSLASGVRGISSHRSVEEACLVFAEKILPVLQKALLEEKSEIEKIETE